MTGFNSFEKLNKLFNQFYGVGAEIEDKGLIATGKSFVNCVKEMGLTDALIGLSKETRDGVVINYYVQQTGNIIVLTDISISKNTVQYLESIYPENVQTLDIVFDRVAGKQYFNNDRAKKWYVETTWQFSTFGKYYESGFM